MGNMEEMAQTFEDLNTRSSGSVWARFAQGARGDAVFEAEARPLMGEIGESLADETRE
jgi:hypothetical protein